MIQRQSEYPSTKTTKLLLSQIQSAFQKEDQQKLSQLLKSIYNDPAYNVNADRWKININSDVYNNTTIGQLFLKMLENIKLFQMQKLKKGINFAFKLHIDVLNSVLKILDDLKEGDSLWICKPLRQVIRATKKIFFSATKREMETGGTVKVKKDDLIIKMQEFKARKTLNQEVKKQIMPLIDNMQVSIMLVYHNYDQISRILKNTKLYGEHGPAFIDNYLFQRGKTAMIYQQFVQAQQYFQKISIRTRGQKRLILKYLIPCKMFLGKNFMANPYNSQQYFPEYQPIIKALNSAKFNDYGQAIKKYQKLWIKRGIYLLMDKLRIILWRNLLKKVQRILGDYKLDMQQIYKAVQLSGGDQNLEECVCIVSNLIYEGKIKGYIFQNQDRKVLVLKKDGDGFPSLAK